MPWGANQLRLTAFPAPNAVIETPNWWELVTGQGPDQVSHNVKQGIYENTGPFADGTLALRIQPLRIDWLYLPAMPDGMPALRETIGTLPEAIEQFARLERWFGLNDCPDLVRFGVGAVVLDPVESREEGYRQLRGFLPAVRLDENSSDFSYQINRPRQSTVVPDLRVNRLSKWSVGKFQSFVANDVGIALVDPRFDCRLETDINSAPDHAGPLARADMGRLFREFLALTSEIAERGDIA